MAMRCAPMIKVTNAFAKSSKYPSVQKILPALNPSKRQQIAQDLRQKSKTDLPKNPANHGC